MKQIENKLGMLISKYGFPEITPHVYDKPSLQNRVIMQEKIVTRVTVTQREITRNISALDKIRNSATQEQQRIQNSIKKNDTQIKKLDKKVVTAGNKVRAAQKADAKKPTAATGKKLEKALHKQNEVNHERDILLNNAAADQGKKSRLQATIGNTSAAIDSSKAAQLALGEQKKNAKVDIGLLKDGNIAKANDRRRNTMGTGQKTQNEREASRAAKTHSYPNMAIELAAMAGGQPAAFAEELRQEKVKKDKAKLNALDAQKRKAQDKRDAEVIKEGGCCPEGA